MRKILFLFEVEEKSTLSYQVSFCFSTRQTGAGSLEIDVIGNLSASCNDECGCLKEEYEPVCGSDERTYYSPCYAGCTAVHRYSDAAEKVSNRHN